MGLVIIENYGEYMFFMFPREKKTHESKIYLFSP